MSQIIKAISCFMLVFINNIYCYTQTCFGLSWCIYLCDRATIRWETPDNRCSLSNTIFLRLTIFSAVFYPGKCHSLSQCFSTWKHLKNWLTTQFNKSVWKVLITTHQPRELKQAHRQPTDFSQYWYEGYHQ